MTNYHKYLPVTALDEKWGFYITTTGYSRTDPNQRYPPDQEHPATHSFTWNKGRILDGYYVVFISRGKGIFESACTPAMDISAGTCFLLFPGVWHRYKPDAKEGWEEYWVGFKGDYPDQLMKRGFFSPDTPCIHAGLHEGLLALFRKLLETVHYGEAGYHQLITGITLQILGLIHILLTGSEQLNDPAGQLIARARFYMHESLERPLDLQQLAGKLHVGYSTFRKMFKQITGLSPHQYHLNLRIDKARELLETTTLTIQEIAGLTGFDSAFYFSRIFSKKNKVSPKAWRSARHTSLRPPER